MKRLLLYNNRRRCCLLAAFVVILALCAPSSLQPQSHSHEWTTIDEVPLSDGGGEFGTTIHALSYPVLGAQDSVAVHNFVQNSELTLLWYFASWCWNCNQEIPILNQMYDRFGGEGFRILGIGVYSPPEDLEKFRQDNDVEFPIVVGPVRVKELENRELTAHYKLRLMVGDQRTWGTPFNIFIVPGDTVRLFAAPGEIRRQRLRAFIQSHLR